MSRSREQRYENNEQLIAVANRILERVVALPGVESAGIASMLPVSFNGNTDWIRFVGRPYNGEHNEVNQRDVSAAYLQTVGATLVRGRYFADADDTTKPRVVIINQALADRYYPGQDPIGQKFGDTSLTPESLKEIVGIVADIREGQLDSEIWPAVYYPFNQSSRFDVCARRPNHAAAVGNRCRHAGDGDRATRPGDRDHPRRDDERQDH